MVYGKKYKESYVKIDCIKYYSFEEVVKFLKEIVIVKFDEIVEIVMNLGVDFCYVD